MNFSAAVHRFRKHGVRVTDNRLSSRADRIDVIVLFCNLQLAIFCNLFVGKKMQLRLPMNHRRWQLFFFYSKSIMFLFFSWIPLVNCYCQRRILLVYSWANVKLKWRLTVSTTWANSAWGAEFGPFSSICRSAKGYSGCYLLLQCNAVLFFKYL